MAIFAHPDDPEFSCAGTIMGLVALVVDRGKGWPGPRQWLDYGAIGVLLLSVGNSLVMWAERTVPSGIAALIVATVPVWILLLDGLRRGGEPWTARVWLGKRSTSTGMTTTSKSPTATSGWPERCASMRAFRRGREME